MAKVFPVIPATTIYDGETPIPQIEADVNATPDTLALRDGDGKFKAATPEEGDDPKTAANKEYADKIASDFEDGTRVAEEAVHSQFADIANQINTDREIEDADVACPPVVFGTVGGAAEVQNGLMKFPYIFGKTIKWNQYAKRDGITATTLTSKGLTCSISADGLVTVTGTIADSSISDRPTFHINGLIGGLTKFYANHSYYLKKIKVRDANITEHNIATGGVIFNTWSLIFNDNSSKVYEHISTFNADINVSLDLTYIVGDSSSYFSNGDVIDEQFRIQIIDLTDIYGAGNEPSTVAEFVRDFPMPYYAYNAGTLLSSKSSSVDFVKRNQWDEETRNGYYDTNGVFQANANYIANKNPILVFPNTEYYWVAPISTRGRWCFYDANMALLATGASTNNGVITSPANARYLNFDMTSAYGTTYNNDICIYINWETPGLPYVAYSKQHITLPNIELRSAGTAYDVAYQQGGGKRRIGVVDMGTLTWIANYDFSFVRFQASLPSGTSGIFNNIICTNYSVPSSALGIEQKDKTAKLATSGGLVIVRDDSYSDAATFKTAMSGVMLYYELATETDITTTENPGWDEYADIDNFGTVKFNQDPTQDIPVPQAYFVRYTVNLVEFLDSVGERAGFDASKIALLEDIVVPDAPTTDGSYTLKVTVSSGTPTYSWVAE